MSKQPMDELDQLLVESKQAKQKLPAFSDLDDLLAESISIREEAKAVGDNREKLKRQNLKPDERAEIEAKVREWEARNLWTPVAVVAVFERVMCSCGYFTDAFSHMMHKQVHKHQKQTTRLIRDDEVPGNLPRIVARQVAEVEICAECADTKGWNLNEAEEIEWQAPKFK